MSFEVGIVVGMQKVALSQQLKQQTAHKMGLTPEALNATIRVRGLVRRAPDKRKFIDEMLKGDSPLKDGSYRQRWGGFPIGAPKNLKRMGARNWKYDVDMYRIPGLKEGSRPSDFTREQNFAQWRRLAKKPIPKGVKIGLGLGGVAALGYGLHKWRQHQRAQGDK
jgi:hypothetical protein